MAQSFDPYHIWLGIPPEDQPPDHYRLLGVKQFESNPDVLESAADQRMTHIRSFQTGKHAAESQKLLNELSAARHCLLNPEKRQPYDQALRAQQPQAAPPATLPKAMPTSPVRPLAVATPLAVQSVAPTSPDLGFDPLEQAGGRRTAKRRRTTVPPVMLAAVGAGLVAVIGIAWVILGGGTDESTPLAARVPGDSATREQRGADDTRESIPARPLPAAPHPSTSPLDPDGVPADDGTQDSMTSADDPAVEPAEDTAGDMPAAVSADEDETPQTAVETRPAPPDAAQQAAALAEVQRALKAEFAAAKKPADKAALAEKLLALVPDSSDPGEQYVLLGEARRLAIAAGAPALALQATEGLAESFAVDRFEELAKTAEELGGKDLSSALKKELAESLEPLTGAALSAGQFAAGKRLARVGLAAARKSNQSELAKTFVGRGKELAAGEKVVTSAAEARENLAKNANDAAAHETLGRYLCLYVGDWPAGLEHLVRSESPALRSVAQLETSADPTPAAMTKLGDAWWDLAEHGVVDASRMRGRAGYWYEQAVGGLTGLTQTRVEKRLEETAATQPNGAGGGVIADKLVLWNCNSNQWRNRGMLSANIELRRADKVVWSKKDIPLAWSRDEEPATTILLPKIPFDALRVVTASFQELGSALCEIEVFRGRDNLARGKPAIASATYDSHSPAALVDGITNSSRVGVGYWVAPDRQPSWVEVQLTPPVRPNMAEAGGGVIADKLVLWNCNSNHWKDRGVLIANVELMRAGKVAWSKKAIRVAWSKDAEPATTIRLPNIRFDVLRIEAASHQGAGSALCEIEVFRGGMNLARGMAVVASGSHHSGHHPASALVDGVTDSSQDGVGYWVAPDHQQAWVEVQVAPPSTPSGKTVYLSDLPATETRIHIASLYDRHPVGGVECTHGLFMPPNHSSSSHVAFVLDQEYRTVSGAAAIADSAGVRSASPLTFRIVGDGTELWRTTIQSVREIRPIRVPVGNVSKLELFVDCPGNADAGHALWVDLVLTRSGATPTVSTKSRPGKTPDEPAVNKQGHAAGVVADKLVLWNCNNHTRNDRGMQSVDVELRAAGRVVWSKKSIPTAWSKDDEPATTVPLPKVAFEAVRVATASFQGIGSALCEVEVFQGNANIASGKPVKGSGSYAGEYSPAAVVDGITDSSRFHVGYWVGPDQQLAWVEVQVAPPTAPTGKTVYLSDLPVLESQVHTGTTLTDSIPVGGATPAHGLFMHPADGGTSHAVYALDKRYQMLSGAAAVGDTAGERSATPLTFRIVGDGKELWRATTQEVGVTRPVNALVSGVTKLELFVDCPGSVVAAHAVWLDLALTRAGPGTGPKAKKSP